MPARQRVAAGLAAAGAITAAVLAVATAAVAQPAGPVAYLSHFSTLKTIASAVPSNGDVNPYGIYVVRHTTGLLQAGDGVDLFVANVLNGTVAAKRKVVRRGTVVRLKLVPGLYGGPPTLVSSTVVASGYSEQTNAAAFVLGPTGVGIGRHDVLYVAETDTSRIFAVHNALTRSGSSGGGTLLTSDHALNMPLGLAIAPDGDVLTVNGSNGKIVETTPAGKQIDSRFLDKSGSPKGAGAPFGLAVAPGRGGVYYVDDAVNTLRLLH